MSSSVLRPRLFFLLKLTVTVGLVGVIVAYADWVAISESLLNANLTYLALVFLAMTLCVSISAYKWKLLLAIHSVYYPFWVLHRHYFVAMFFNNFLPSSIGGDGYRIYKTLDNPGSGTVAAIAVIMERLSGIASLLVLGFIGAGVGLMRQPNHPVLEPVFFGGLAGIALCILAVALARWHRLRKWLAGKRWKLPNMIQDILLRLGDFRRKPGLVIRVVVISIGFHLFTLGWFLLLVHSLGGVVHPADLIVVLALLSVVTVIPLSINGIGLVDGSFIVLAGLFGLGYETALGVMLLQRTLLIPISLVGAAIFFRDRKVDLSTKSAQAGDS